MASLEKELEEEEEEKGFEIFPPNVLWPPNTILSL